MVMTYLALERVETQLMMVRSECVTIGVTGYAFCYAWFSATDTPFLQHSLMVSFYS